MEDYEIMLEEFMIKSDLFNDTFTVEQLIEIKDIFKRKNPNILDPKSNALEILNQSIIEWRQNKFGRLISSARPDKDGLITAYAGGDTPPPVPSPPPSPSPPSAPSPVYDTEEIFSYNKNGKLIKNGPVVRSLNYPYTQQGQKRRRKSKKKSRKSKSSKKKSKSSKKRSKSSKKKSKSFKKRSKSSKKKSKSFKKNLRSKIKIKRK